MPDAKNPGFSPKAYQSDCLLGALGALFMLVGDWCLSVIPASPGDSGLFAREANLNGSWEPWRLPLLLATGLCGMALGFFTVCASVMQILPQYKNTRRTVLVGGVIYVATAGVLHFLSAALPTGHPRSPRCSGGRRRRR